MQSAKTAGLLRFAFQFVFILLFLIGQSLWGNIPVSAAPADRPPANLPPSVSLNVPAEAFIGETITFTVTFDNVNTVPGYGPLIDLIIPRNGADGAQNTDTMDGLTFLSAKYLGIDVEKTVLTFPGSGGVTCVAHPYMVDNTGNPVQVCGDAGDTFVALRLPFGSFTPAQPPLVVDVTVSMSNLADLGTPLTIQARGGYQFGYTPLNDWCCGDDPSLSLSGWTSGSVTPTLFTLEKTYSGPEDETATGPNFPRRYTVTAVIAPGQTMTSFTLTDVLPNNMQFVSVVSTTPGGATCTTPSTAAPGGTLSCDFASASGTVTMTFEYYIPLRDAGGGSVINPASGDDVTSCNNAGGGGTWTPPDPRDTGGTFTQNPPGCEHTLTDKSIAIQKGVVVLGGGDPVPGKTLEYTLDFQISDFFAFNTVAVTDTISDGQHFDASFIPTLEINGNTYTLAPANFNAANYDVTCNYTGGPGPECTANDPAPNDGTTTLAFRVSNEIITRGQDGRLIGGCVPTGGTGGSDPDCGSFNDGPTTGRIVFHTLVQQNFTDIFPSGDSSVDQGDTMDNAVNIAGNVLSTSDASTPTGQTEADDSSASVSIGHGQLTKSIYAINGVAPASPVEVKPGDTVTYRLIYTLTSGDVEDLSFDDYLPLPVFHVGDPDEDGAPGPAWTFDPTVSAAVPAAGVAKFGPSDSFYAYSSIIPTVSSDTSNNRLDFFYGDFDGASEGTYIVDILFTVTVSDDPFADRLYLTNQAHAFEGSTNAGTADANAIVQIILTEPALTTAKSAVASDNSTALFTPSLPVAFTAPGSAGPRWSGTISSTTLPIDSDISGVDAGDLVTFAIFIENSGSSINGAFDIVIQDVFDAVAFEYPTPGDPASINLQIYYGNGSGPISYTKPDDTVATPGDLFGGGIKLVDPVGQGVCQAHDPNSGNNVIVILYDLRLKSNIAPGVYTNTGSLTNYSGSEGGPNFLPQPESDDADVTVSNPASAKALVSTEINDAYNGASQVVIGEIATYTVTLTIPEGVTPNAQLVDTLDMGLAFVALDSATLSPSLSITGSTTPVITDSGRTVTFNFGDITNTDTDNTTPETIVLTYRVVTLNIISNQSGWGLNNRVRFSWTGGSVEASAPNVTVIEPTINTTKSVLPASADAGDTVTFTVTLSNPASGSTTAHDVSWSDTIPAGLSYVAASLTPGACTASTPPTWSDASAPTLTASGGLFQPGESCTITFQATVDYSVYPGQTIPNAAQTQWTSMSGTVTDRSSYNADSDERDGSGGLLGSGAVNDYRTEGTATVTINQVAPQKSIVATSEAHTVIAGGTERVVVGEIVRYRLVVQWPEGTSLNAMLRDNLPAGLQFLDSDPPVNTKVAFVCNGGAACMNSSTLGSGPVVSGNETNVGSITPSYVLPDAAVSSSPTTDNDTYGSSTDPYFKFGDLVNNDSDADQEFVVLEFNALVLNISGNQSGTNRDNSFTVRINGSDIVTSNNVNVTIAEPNLSLSKSILPPAPTDAGDTFTYRLVITNTSSGVNAATAFDIVLTDTFDAYLTNPVVTSLTTTQPAFCNGGTLATLSSLVAGSTVTVDASCLDPSRTITVDISVTVVAGATAGYTIPNTGNLTYTSLPGTGTSPNPTGGTTPGGSGAGDGERNGQDGVGGALNDYAATGSVNAPLAAPQIDKLAPTPTSYVIGEQVTFDILVTLPEGVTPALQVADDLPAGLEYVSHQVITTAAASGGLLAADYNGAFTNDPPTFTCSGTCGSGDDITLAFGDTTTAADNVANNNAFLVRVVARVLNVAGNQNGTALTNTATVSWTGGSASDSTNITLREPELDVQKVADDTAWLYGQTVTYTITVSHLGSSTADAYDLTITDTIPNVLTYVPGSITASAGCTANDSGAPTLTWTCATLALSSTATLTYQVTVNSPPGPPPFLTGDTTVTNTADLTWTSLSGSNPDERTGSGGVNDYADSDTETGGLEQYYALGNRVWFDTNNNAQIDAGEVGVDGVTVELYAADGSGNPTGAVLAADVTSGGGYYHFDYLLPGDYVVVLPASNFASGGVLEGYWSSLTSRADSGAISETPAPDADDDVDSDDNGTLQTSGAFNGAVLSQAVTLGGAAEPTGETDLEAGVGQGAQPDNRANMTVDFGFYRVQIGNLVFEDINVNGNYDSGTDNVLGGVTVELLSGDGSTVLATTTTSPGGLYLFSNQPAGNYIVRVTAPSGMISTVDTYAPADTANPDTNTDDNDNGVGTAGGAVSSNQLTMQGGESGSNIIINNASGTTTDPTVDFGFVYPYALGNRVWFDTNNNSQIDFGTEVGVDGVVVNLYRNDGTGTYVFVATDTTTGGGYYLFDNLLPGEYIVALPASNFAAGGVLNGYWSSATTLSGAGAITETAAPDPDNDTDSDDNGTLQTSGAFNGQVISLPVTLGPTGLTEPLNESDLEAGVGQGVQPDGRANMTVDFGFYRVSVGNLVYTDGDENGNYDGGPLDAPLPGITVRLYASDGTTEIPVGPDGILGTADDAPGGMATNASGEYRFDGLPQGDYIVRVVAPPSTTSAIDTYNAADSANPNTNADNNDNGLGTGAGTVSSAVFTLTPGSTGALNNNIITHASGSTHNPTLDFGFIPQYALGNRVWFDTNNNGQIDAGEAGIDGVTVELYAADGSGNPTGAALATDTTANGGYYLFNNLASGRYVVVIPASNFTGVLNGYWSSGTTRNNDGSLTEIAAPGPDNDVDSDDNGQLNLFGSLPGAVASRAVTLGLGPVEPTGEADLDGGNQGQPDAWANMTVDFGFYTIRLGNQVWNDADNSGLLDGAETGMDGVTVELWSADGSTLLDTTTTSGGGIYTFSGLPQGSYLVRLPEGNFQGTGALRDYYSSAGPANAYEPAPNPDINLTDSDDNGTEVGSLGFAGGYIQSGVFALTPAAEQTFNNADGSTTEFRVDFGVRREVRVNLSAAKDDGVAYYLPGGTLTYNIVIRNDGPADVTGATVADNIPSQIASWEWTCVTTGGATCAGSGGFISTNFTDTVDMPVGSTITYTVNVNIAAAATGTLDNTVTVTPPTGVIETDNSDNSDTDSDLAAILSIDKDDGVTVVSPGQVITYTLTVSNTGTLDLSNIRVTDTLPSEVTFQSAVPAPTSVAGGTLTWTGISLAAGASTTIQVAVRVNDDAVGPTITNNVTVEDTTIPGLTDSDDDTDIILTIFSKALIATNQTFTDDPAVAIGEILTYQITITVPAGGSMSNLTVTDILDRGLAFVECASIAASSADVTTTLPGGFNDACNDPGNPQVFTEPAGSTNPADRGRRVVFNLGTVSNSGATDGAVTIRYTAAVLDNIENQDGVRLNNSATLAWDSGSLSAAAAEVVILEPDFALQKTVNQRVALPGTTLTFTLTFGHTVRSNIDAFDVVLTDVLPAGLTYVPGSLTIVSGPPGGVTDDTAAPTLTVTWPSFPLLTGANRTAAVVQFQAIFEPTAGAVTNMANLEWTSLPGDVSAPQSNYNSLSTERYYDPRSNVNVYGVQDAVTIYLPVELPETGFAPGVVTAIPPQPADKAYSALGDLWLEIPKLGVKLSIVGIPAKDKEWDLTWLWNQAGWLEGTAYPTHAGNSALTAHVYLPNGEAGPFFNLGNLMWGDRIIVHLGGQKYIYEVRQTRQVSPYSFSPLRHEDLPWLTLITCREYDPVMKRYRYRVIVRAVLIQVVNE